MVPSPDNKPTPSKPLPWNDPAVRSVVFQVLAAAVLVAFFYYIFKNTLHNMESRGISTGFSFLSNEAGFGILMSLIDYNESYSYGRTFFVGLLNTLLVSVLGIVIATVLGFSIGIARLSKNWLVAKIATVYIETLRNIPLLLQILFWYFSVLQVLPHPRQSMSIGKSVFLNNRGLYIPRPLFENGFGMVTIAFAIAVLATFIMLRWARRRQKITGQQFPIFLASVGILAGLPLLAFIVAGMPLSWELPVLRGFNFTGGTTIIPEFMALLWALSTYTATFIAETVRAGVLSVSHGQTEAARALGMKPGHIMRLVITPQAMRVIIPPLTSQYLNLVKNSSLATAVGYPDLVSVFMGTTLNQTGQAVEIVAMTMAVYLTISLSISTFMNWYNKRVAITER